MTSILLPASVTAKAPAPHLTARYVHVDSEAIVQAMKSEGFKVAAVTTAKSRVRDALYARHTIDFRHPDAPQLGDATPRVLFSNSHDGSSRAVAIAGVFRAVCANGLVVGTTYANERTRHTGDMARSLVERMMALAKNTAPLFAQIERWKSKELTPTQTVDFARLAAQLRYGDPYRFASETLLAVRRPEDDAGDLWSVFNRVQEATVVGGVTGLSRTGRQTTSRPLNEVAANLRYNAALWNLAEEFSTL